MTKYLVQVEAGKTMWLMVLEVLFCDYLVSLLFNSNVRQKPMLESQWWSKAVYLISAGRAGEGGRESQG